MDVSEHTENFVLTFLLSPLLSYRILGRPNLPIPLCLGRLPRE